MMYEELVKELWKYCHAWLDDKPYDIPKLAMEAAEAIEKLEAKNKELESKMHDSFTEHLLNQISCKEKQLEEAKEEIELYKNTHYKLQYKGKELTASEVGRKLDELEKFKEAEREKGCEFCNAEYAVMSGSRMTYDGIHKGCTAKYCPMCGKRLVRE